MSLTRVLLPLFLIVAPLRAQNAATTVNVDANAARHPISPNIYGFAFGSQTDLSVTNFSLNRSGGNATSTYNWQINATNHASDWYFESILDPPQTAGYDGDSFITQTRSANVGAQPLLTIPMIDYLAKLGSNGAMTWSFSIAKYGAQTGHDLYQPDAGNGISSATGKNITGNNPLDANTPNAVSIQQGWVQHLVNTWGASSAGGLKYYIMDNEPSLWNSTHRDIHPSPVTYNELYNDFVTYAAAVRGLDPNAQIVGPEEWGWWAMFLSGYDQTNGIGASGSDYNTHNHIYYYPWLLQQLKAYQQTTGTQLLNVLSVHYYPQELSNSDDDSLAGQKTRNQSTRVLWDPNYVDPSWLNQVGIDGGIVNLIPTLKGWVNQYYPGLQTGITEYNWGDEAHLNGATTQADVLGIFGREGLDMATRWTVPANPSPTYLALQMYRNYDGNRSTFGDTSVSAAVANPDNLSSFAAVRSSDGALTIMVINKQQGTTPVTLSLANFSNSGTAHAYQISSASQSSITPLGSVTVANNAITATLPSQSITLYVIPAGTITSLPTAPTGLTATVGSGTVNLTWTPGGGATSYTVGRATVSGGPYATLATTTAAAYADAGLTNGVTYYYVVAGVNSAGTGPNSAELGVTPIAPPTFTSSATASPNPDVQGTATTVHAAVTCTANSLSNGNVQIMVLDPNGSSAALQNFTGQNFAPQQLQNYALTFTPTLSGAYTIQVGVFSSTWQQWAWNASAGTISVTSSLSFTSSATAPSQVVPGGSAPISLTVTNTGTGTLTGGNVELQIFNASGTAVATQVWSAQNFTGGQSQPYSYTWTPASNLPAGVYSVDVGVFDSTWAHNYYWNTDATITVAAATSPAVSLSPASLSFATQTVGTSSPVQAVTLTNTGSGALSVTSITITGSNASDFTQTNTCGTSVAAGAKCTISVVFKPTGKGNRSASVSLKDNAANSPQSIGLSGKGR
ncbi:MAG TPA: glycoside hydrolase family 44 protein [Candidatus Sulfopaludibacter sp.]|jgi:hypothetical protein|nr:glycoside hydrolase family 44 protein [Candidatus Sulfopaludibacter sp.]